MKVVSQYVREQKRYTKNDLKSKFSFDEDGVEKFIKSLKAYGVLKSVKNTDDQLAMSDLMDDDVEITDETAESGDCLYVFTYVGIITCGSRVIKVYPKYLLSKKDEDDLRFGCANDVDFIFASFVRRADDVNAIRKILIEEGKPKIQIIAKIENQEGYDNLDSILESADGVMVARGDLGTEIPSEMLPIVQKQMIKTCRRLGKIAIVATEMLETMMENNRPKRAETSDIANAVFDGTDAVMLSGETTVGKHPIETVAAMANICETAEKYAEFNYSSEDERVIDAQSAIADAVVDTTKRLNAKLICAATISGSTARVISNLKPKATILALVPDEKTGRRLALNWGVYPTILPVCNSTDEVLTKSVACAKDYTELVSGDIVVTTGGFPNNAVSRTTNLMKIEVID